METATPSQDLKKTCTKCGHSGPLDDFYEKKSGKHGRAAECRSCTGKRTNSRYYGPKNAEIKRQGNQYGRGKTQLMKDKVFQHYGGWKCACCGEMEKLFLTLDHVNNDGGEFRKAHFGKQGAAGMVTYRWLITHGFVEGLQVLCANCQHGKRLNNGVCPHQERCNDQVARP
jgi:hypothetical protein